MKRYHLPGFAITIVEGQDVLYEKGLGYANREQNLKVNSSSIFKLWSVSKAFTAIEIFREVEEGLIDLDEPLSEYLPDFKIQSDFGAEDQISIRSILAHQSGLPRNECLKVPVIEGQTGTLDRFEIGTWDCIKATPTGTRYKYSNLGYDLLGRVIEENRQAGYATYMRDHLLRPLGMTSATFNSADISDKDRLVLGYEFYKRKYYPLLQTDINSIPSGNLYSSLEDLTNFLKSVFKGDLFRDKATFSQMHEIHYDTKFYPETMGLGWKTAKIRDKELLVWHDGGPGEGIGALIAFLPGQNLGIAMAANSTSFSGVESVQLASRILEKIKSKGSDPAIEAVSEADRARVDPEVLNSYQGSYIAWGTVMRIKPKKEKLKGKIDGLGLDLIPLNDYEFRVSSWVDRLGLTKIFRLPMDLNKIRISFLPLESPDSITMVINMNYFNYEICPRYPDNFSLPENMQELTDSYEMAWRLPYSKAGPMSGNIFSITLENSMLIMSGVFGPILPLSNNRIRILSGPFAGEIIEYEQTSGQLIHQNGIFLPLSQN